MKVVVSVNGRFHAFDLARQLHKHNVLHKLITSYPRFKALEWEIDKQKIKSLLATEVLNRTKKYLPSKWNDLLTVRQKEWFDKRVSRNIPSDADIFVGWSGNSLHSIRKAKEKGLTTIIERGSAHILTQQQILSEEYEKYGLKPNLAPQPIIEKELQEYQEADYISIPSSFVRRSFLEHGIEEKKFIQVPYGVDLSHFGPINKVDSVFRVIFAGGLSVRKGSHYLLQAISELDLPDFEFWHLGGVSKEMAYIIQKYKSEKVVFKGHKSQNELHKYYSQGSVFIMPSLEDGFGMVLPQAMACGLPTVCTTNTGGKDLIEHGKEGFVIPICDVEAIKEKIIFFYENPDICRQMGEAARLKASAAFTWDDYGRTMLEKYKDILIFNNKGIK